MAKQNNSNDAPRYDFSSKKQMREPTIMELAAEGDVLLTEEKAPVTKNKSSPNNITKPNPYVAARPLVLQELSPLKRREVLDMEANHDTDNRFYDEFVKLVCLKGDELSL